MGELDIKIDGKKQPTDLMLNYKGKIYQDSEKRRQTVQPFLHSKRTVVSVGGDLHLEQALQVLWSPGRAFSKIHIDRK